MSNEHADAHIETRCIHGGQEKCAVTGAPAKFFDPVTQAPYATLEAFRTLRGRTGGRRSGAA